MSLWTVSHATAEPAFKGMSYTPWSENVLATPQSDQSIAEMKAIDVDTVALNVWWFQDHVNATVITEDFNYYSASTDSVVHAIGQIHSEGMRVMLKPMVDCRDGTWRGQINPSDAWFTEYGSFINYWADVAAAQNVGVLSVGCEFKKTVGWSDSWRNVVSGVRARYSGDLVYSANHDSYQAVSWWDAMDYIGVDAYFPLTDKNDPTPAELQQAWQEHGNTLESWRNEEGYAQPIAFTEVGYRSGDGANQRPWEWGNALPVDLQEQVDCYEALLSTLWDEDWWGGAFWWNWETDPEAGSPPDDRFTPQNKSAEDVVASYYAPEPATLVWDGTTNEWGSEHWDNGSGLASPVGGENMVVASGRVDVEHDYTGDSSAMSLLIEGGTVDVSDTGELEVTGSVTTAETSGLIVDGVFSADGPVTMNGLLGGSGRIVAGTVVIGGVFSPGNTGGSPGEFTGTWLDSQQDANAVPEPSTLVLLGIGAVALLAHARRTRGMVQELGVR